MTSEIVERLGQFATEWQYLSDERGLASAAMSEAASLISSLVAERDAAKGKLALIVDRIVYSDSYGVPGSDFQCCHLCTGGGAPGINFEHDEHCPVRHVERDYEQWFDDIRATDEALRETENRALTAERLLAEAVEQAFRDGLAYGGNVENADPDVAWLHSKARATLSTGGVNG